MPPGSQGRPGWADLPQELALGIAALLENDDRLALMHTCSGWFAALAAGPRELIPAAVLVGPPPFKILQRHCCSYCGSHRIDEQQARDRNAASTLQLLGQAASLSPRVQRVRVEGEAQVTTVPALLLALPPGVRYLELDVSPCAGPLLPALERFTQLQELRISGNGADVQWGLGRPAVLRPLRQLCIDMRRLPQIVYAMTEDADMEYNSLVPELPRSVCAALPAATGLHTLELRVTWSNGVVELCRALPALQDLRLHLHYCMDDHATAAVAMLMQLPQLSALALGIHACIGSELDTYYPDGEEIEEFVILPQLAGLSALTQLYVAGFVDLSPDWRQLSRLQRLVVFGATAVEGDPFEWGSAPLTGLSSLTRLDVDNGADCHTDLPDPAVLATAPRLAEVHAPSSPVAWRAELAALRPDVLVLPTVPCFARTPILADNE